MGREVAVSVFSLFSGLFFFDSFDTECDDGVIEENDPDQSGKEVAPAENVQEDTGCPTEQARSEVVGKQVNGDGDGAFRQVVVTDDTVAKDVDDEEVEGEYGQADSYQEEVSDIE